jgi:hypothetical protein
MVIEMARRNFPLPLSEEHTGEAIAKKVIDCLQELGF